MESYFIHTKSVVQFFRCLEPQLGNDLTNVGLQILNCLLFARIKLFLNSAPQKIVSRYQVAASWRPIVIDISVN